MRKNKDQFELSFYNKTKNISSYGWEISHSVEQPPYLHGTPFLSINMT